MLMSPRNLHQVPVVNMVSTVFIFQLCVMTAVFLTLKLVCTVYGLSVAFYWRSVLLEHEWA